MHIPSLLVLSVCAQRLISEPLTLAEYLLRFACISFKIFMILYNSVHVDEVGTSSCSQWARVDEPFENKWSPLSNPRVVTSPLPALGKRGGNLMERSRSELMCQFKNSMLHEHQVTLSTQPPGLFSIQSWDLSEEQGERFHQDLRDDEERYQGTHT
ncbi:hypothetical protein EVAR_55856_1 [Eumeta japonica]|uniref:Uncharacterized protein n=1 Tax=Eumeta variegata TaxID=151549 RepID=A0A4C1Z8I3_EUMVA|nr:hypothetical protein EVAR_55856_1 [Eumeta japonica]